MTSGLEELRNLFRRLSGSLDFREHLRVGHLPLPGRVDPGLAGFELFYRLGVKSNLLSISAMRSSALLKLRFALVTAFTSGAFLRAGI
jgi:hypothetical protein